MSDVGWRTKGLVNCSRSNQWKLESSMSGITNALVKPCYIRKNWRMYGRFHEFFRAPFVEIACLFFARHHLHHQVLLIRALSLVPQPHYPKWLLVETARKGWQQLHTRRCLWVVCSIRKEIAESNASRELFYFLKSATSGKPKITKKKRIWRPAAPPDLHSVVRFSQAHQVIWQTHHATFHHPPVFPSARTILGR